jgi:hypothetical protein
MMGSKDIGLVVYDAKHNVDFVFDTTTLSIRFLFLFGTPDVGNLNYLLSLLVFFLGRSLPS